MGYLLQFARKNKYGSLGWAFDCDEHGNITDEKMLQGYNDMIAKCQTWKDSHNSNVEIKDMFDVWNKVIKVGKIKMDSFFVIGTKRIVDDNACPLTEDKQYYEYYRTDSITNSIVLGGLFGADVFETKEEAKKAWNENEAYLEEQFFQRAYMFDLFYNRKSTAILEIGVKDEVPLT